MKYKTKARKASKRVEDLFDVINKYGREDDGNGAVKDGEWSKLWWIACALKTYLDQLESAEEDLKDYVVEEVAKKVLKIKGINLKEIIEKYQVNDY